jgi:hypothetical protein
LDKSGNSKPEEEHGDSETDLTAVCVKLCHKKSGDLQEHRPGLPSALSGYGTVSQKTARGEESGAIKTFTS